MSIRKLMLLIYLCFMAMMFTLDYLGLAVKQKNIVSKEVYLSGQGYLDAQCQSSLMARIQAKEFLERLVPAKISYDESAKYIGDCTHIITVYIDHESLKYLIHVKFINGKWDVLEIDY